MRTDWLGHDGHEFINNCAVISTLWGIRPGSFFRPLFLSDEMLVLSDVKRNSCLPLLVGYLFFGLLHLNYLRLSCVLNLRSFRRLYSLDVSLIPDGVLPMNGRTPLSPATKSFRTVASLRSGGYVECLNIDPDVVAEMYKVASISLCSNTSGQILVDLMVDPPKPGDPSYELYHQETTGTYEALKRRAIKLVAFFNTLPGMSCAPPEGALYVHPRVQIPQKAIDEANAKGQEPDEFYAMEMLRDTGVCVVPGSGFLQEPGTWHFRSVGCGLGVDVATVLTLVSVCSATFGTPVAQTFLPPEEEFDSFMGRIDKFHRKFMEKYA